jgi:phosphoglycerol transferase MdoB-like AlkP superfamily enzyme
MKFAKGRNKRPARHVFLIIMESYDTWPLLNKYSSLGLTNNLKKIAEQGIFVKNFLPSADVTLNSFSSIITSLPFTDVPFNYLDTSKIPYPSSVAQAFKRLGYRTRFFHGGDLYSGNLAGYRVWGDFVRDQGFEEQYGGAQDIREHYNEWGVDDEYLFDYVATRVDDRIPSFNVIFTTSYHAPYKVDVWNKGFPLRSVPDDLKSIFNQRVTTLQSLGHLWYADRCLGNFVRKMEEKLRNSLFVVTGDHKSRRFIHAHPEYFEESAVPLVLYGRDVLEGLTLPDGMTGSHIDIAPTLIELVAPKGFQYYAMGKDLFDSSQSRLSIGFWRIIGPDFIVDLRETPRFHPLPGKELPAQLPDFDELRLLLQKYYGISWWRVHYGYHI